MSTYRVAAAAAPYRRKRPAYSGPPTNADRHASAIPFARICKPFRNRGPRSAANGEAAGQPTPFYRGRPRSAVILPACYAGGRGVELALLVTDGCPEHCRFVPSCRALRQVRSRSQGFGILRQLISRGELSRQCFRFARCLDCWPSRSRRRWISSSRRRSSDCASERRASTSLPDLATPLLPSSGARRERRVRLQLLLHRDGPRHAAGRHAAGAAHRMLLSLRCIDG